VFCKNTTQLDLECRRTRLSPNLFQNTANNLHLILKTAQNKASPILHWEAPCLNGSIFLICDFTSVKLMRGALFVPKLYTNGLSWDTISWHYIFKKGGGGNCYLLNPCKGVAISHLDAFILTPARLCHVANFFLQVVYCGWAYFIPAQGIITVFSY
jgi:hypothetical protein